MALPLNVTVNREVCIGAANCEFFAPEAFEVDDDGLVVIRDANVASPESIRAAAANCPSGAIAIEQ